MATYPHLNLTSPNLTGSSTGSARKRQRHQCATQLSFFVSNIYTDGVNDDDILVRRPRKRFDVCHMVSTGRPTRVVECLGRSLVGVPITEAERTPSGIHRGYDN